MNIKSTVLFVMMGLSVTILGCKDKSNDPAADNNTSTGKLTDSDKANLYDVVWYATAQGGGIDLEFLSDGIFRQAKSLEGSWEWQNNGDTMDVQDYSGKRFQMLFDEITPTTMKYRSNLGGDNFNTQAVYSTTK